MKTEEINKVIDHLAEKLQIPAAHVWEVLKNQVFYDGIGKLITALITAGLLAGISFWLYRTVNAPDFQANDDLNIPKCVMGGTLILFLLMALAINCDISYFITCFFNPDYLVLEKVLRLIK